MTVEYSEQAVLDLYKISESSKREYGNETALQLSAHIRKLIEQISADPESRSNVVQRPGVRVAALVRYPFKLFYQVSDGAIRILHIRHTSQRPGN